jgi:hypothetical protein
METLSLGGRGIWVALTKTALCPGRIAKVPVGTIMIGALEGNCVAIGKQITVSRTIRNGILSQKTTPVMEIREIEPGKKIEVTTWTSIYTIEYDSFAAIFSRFQNLLNE